MSIVLVGSTSGSITLQEPAVAGSTVLDLPATSGTVAITASPTFTGTATIPTATITTLNAPTGVLATQNGMTGIAKAWASYQNVSNGTPPSLNGSYNVSSLTRNSNGNYTINFTTAMPNANYAVAGIGEFIIGTAQSVILNPILKTTTNFVMYMGYVSATNGNITLYDYGFDFILIGN